MFSLILTIIAPLLALVGGLSTQNQQAIKTQSVQQNQNFFQSACYQIEPDVKLIITKEDLDTVHSQYSNQPLCYGADAPIDPPNGLIGEYTLLRRGVELIPFKVEKEGEPYSGGCELGSAIRTVAQKPDGTKIYWEPSNYKEQDIRQFVEVFKGKNGKNYVYDIYARDTILDNLPDYITNCVESGGLVPVVETNTNIVPPQSIPLDAVIKDASSNTFYSNYENFLLEDPDTFPPNKNYLMKLEKQNVPKKALKNDQGKIGEYPITIEGKSYIYDIYFHVGSFYVRDQNSLKSWVYDATAESPPININHDPSLQLKALQFRLADSWTVFTPVCKPAIYLYPEKDTTLSVGVVPHGKLTKTIPDYGDGWNILAQKNGQILSSGNTYPYLYYEADLVDGYKPTTGWVISKDDIESKLSGILKSVGLNPNETRDFLSYWVPRLSEKPYYFAGLVTGSEIDEKERLTISQEPDSSLRVRFIFEGLDAPISVVAPSTSSFTRQGFVLVDWGGSLIGKSCEGTVIH